MFSLSFCYDLLLFKYSTGKIALKGVVVVYAMQQCESPQFYIYHLPLEPPCPNPSLPFQIITELHPDWLPVLQSSFPPAICSALGGAYMSMLLSSLKREILKERIPPQYIKHILCFHSQIQKSNYFLFVTKVCTFCLRK